MAPTSNINVSSELQGAVVALFVEQGSHVRGGDVLALIESMKMHHEVIAPISGVVQSIVVAAGETVGVGQQLFGIVESLAAEMDEGVSRTPAASPTGLDRDDLREVIERHRVGLDAERPDAVERRHAKGRRTTRENIADLVDEGTFVEYGPLVIAAQRRRRSVEDLIASTPADGLVGGIGEVNRTMLDAAVSARTSKVVAVSYDTRCSREHKARRTIARRIDCSRWPSSCVFRSSSSPRVEADDPVTPMASASAGSTAWRFAGLPNCREPCRSSGSPQGIASRGTRRSSDVAMSSSPRRTRTSAWAAQP